MGRGGQPPPRAIAALLRSEFGYENTDYCVSPASALPDNVFATAIALGLMAFTAGAMAQSVDQYRLARIEQTVNRIVTRARPAWLHTGQTA
jgi:hypothetical protein